jgi:CBS domain containing-hemolysin-like protein
MTSFTFAIILLLLALAGVVLRKTYFYLPIRELKRRASRRDRFAESLYRAVSYGPSLNVLLWLFVALTSAGGFVLMARIAPVWLSLVAVVLLLLLAFSWLPATKVTSFGARLTLLATPFIAWLLNLLYPLLRRAAHPLHARASAIAHTGMFERADLLEVLEQQSKQEDSRIHPEELDILRQTLEFNDRKVGDMLNSRHALKVVAADDTIGPVLIDEIHRSHQPLILVSDGGPDDIIGTLDSQKLGLGSSGQVRDHMSQAMYYLHEDDSLGEVLRAFYATGCPAFIVVNSHKEYVGILDVKAVIGQLLHSVPQEDDDIYTKLDAVADRHNSREEMAEALVEASEDSEPPESTVQEDLSETDETVIE